MSTKKPPKTSRPSGKVVGGRQTNKSSTLPEPLEKKYLKVKEWRKFSYDIQVNLLKQFDVILTDHRTKRQQLKYVLDNYPRWIDQGIKIFNKGMDKFDQGLNDTLNQFGEGLGKNNFGDIEKTFYGSKKSKMSDLKRFKKQLTG